MANNYTTLKPLCVCWALSALMIINAGCRKFLSVDPPNADVKSEVVYANDVTANSAVTGIYTKFMDNASLISGSSSSVLTLAGLSSDELVNYSRNASFVEFEQNEIHPSNSYIFSLWSTTYSMIYQANAIIEGINASKGLSDAARSQLMGEALFARAFCYFYMVNLFGDVPLVLTTDYIKNAVMQRTGVDLVYDQILTDLEAARGLLTTGQAAPYEERIRVNKFAADAMLSRAYLYRGKWAQAESMATEVINNTQMYQLVDSVSDIFLMNSMESIWQLRPTFNDDRGYVIEAIIFSPRDVLKYNPLRPGTVEAFEPGDHRFRHWIEYLVVGLDTIYFPRKYKQNNLSEYFTEYSSVLRLAEVYLIRAEARAMQNNLSGENSAVSDINKIRLRAGLNETTATTQPEILDEILRQRRLELMAEAGHRWFDLKRLGKAGEVLRKIKPGFEDTDVLYPVPDVEFRNNPKLGEQNSGY